MVHDGHARGGRDILPTGVDQIAVFLSVGARAVTDHTVF